MQKTIVRLAQEMSGGKMRKQKKLPRLRCHRRKDFTVFPAKRIPENLSQELAARRQTGDPNRAGTSRDRGIVLSLMMLLFVRGVNAWPARKQSRIIVL
jgi:hypothetical protein